MSEHLSEDIIEQLSKHQLRGEERLAALVHLGECEICRRRIKSPTKVEFLERLLVEEEYEEEIEDESISAQPDQPLEQPKQNTSTGESLLVRFKNYFLKKNYLFFAG